MWYSATTFWFNQIKLHAPIAQLVEQLPFKEKVPGSNPGGRTSEMKWNDYAHRAQGFCEAIAEQKAVARFEARLSLTISETKTQLFKNCVFVSEIGPLQFTTCIIGDSIFSFLSNFLRPENKLLKWFGSEFKIPLCKINLITSIYESN